ncbi:MAG: hypothetical protein KKA62_05400 [Nanoarchaeota archaeon]|nr:hypothetical protein [Nanoarchaeota archaeon]MBU1644571.1 hypothetical protein [Nanoarchaeota archaeon]MBU1977358.1 hypothetical protein [Nanoarchaeota archaeon]
MRPANLSLPSGQIKLSRKGFIFSLDLVLGITIAFSVIFVAVFFVSQASSANLSDYQLLRIGSDVVVLLENEGVFESLDYAVIETELQKITPSNYEMLLRITGDFALGNGIIEVGGEIPDRRVVLAGKRVVLTSNDDLLTVTYFIWPREQIN